MENTISNLDTTKLFSLNSRGSFQVANGYRTDYFKTIQKFPVRTLYLTVNKSFLDEVFDYSFFDYTANDCDRVEEKSVYGKGKTKSWCYFPNFGKGLTRAHNLLGNFPRVAWFLEECKSKNTPFWLIWNKCQRAYVIMNCLPYVGVIVAWCHHCHLCWQSSWLHVWSQELHLLHIYAPSTGLI